MSFRPPAPADVTLAVLAGGEGTRMGTPKSLLRIKGRPILEDLLDRLDWPGPSALITAPGREHPPGWQRFEAEFVDPVNGLGPLRGALTAMENARTEWIAVIPVDMPGIGRETLDALLASTGDGELGKMYQRLGVGEERIIEPFPLLVRRSAAAIVRERIERRRLSVVKLLEEPGFVTHDAARHWGEQTWTNLNRPEDLGRFCNR